MTVAANIKRYREKMGLTQEELAEKLGVARSTVTQWENGWSSPRMGKVQQLARVFHVTTADIVSERIELDTHDADLERVIAAYRSMNKTGHGVIADMAESIARQFPFNT